MIQRAKELWSCLGGIVCPDWRGWKILSRPITLALIITKMTPEAEGRVLNMHTPKSLDVDAALRAAREANLIVAVEEHSAVGGLGSAVAEVLAAKRNRHCSLLMLNLGDKPPHAVGRLYLGQKLGMDSSGIAHAVRERLRVHAQSAV